MYRPYARRLSRTKNVRVSDGDPSRNQSHPNEDDKPPGRWFLRSSSHLAILPLNTLRHYGRYIRSSSLGPCILSAVVKSTGGRDRPTPALVQVEIARSGRVVAPLF